MFGVIGYESNIEDLKFAEKRRTGSSFWVSNENA
jgi:hypothetical protein